MPACLSEYAILDRGVVANRIENSDQLRRSYDLDEGAWRELPGMQFAFSCGRTDVAG